MTIRFALLYPTPDAAEDDFIGLAARCAPPSQVVPIHIPWPDGVGDLAALDTEQTYAAVRELGSDTHLTRVVPALPDADVAIFAVTSASFLHGTRGVQDQLRTVRALTGVPCTSTTSAFQQALRHLGVTRASLASVYHPSAADHFVDRLADVGVRTISRVDADAPSDRALAGWSSAQIVDLVRACVHRDAEVVVLPETALHTADIADVLDAAAGCPVLTATQVSIWDAYRTHGERAHADDAGVLFRGNR
jgi:maleate cis-trans isomerase